MRKGATALIFVLPVVYSGQRWLCVERARERDARSHSYGALAVTNIFF